MGVLMNGRIRLSCGIFSFFVFITPLSALAHPIYIGQQSSMIGSNSNVQGKHYNMRRRVPVRIPASFFAGIQRYNKRLAHLHFREMRLRKENKTNAANAVQAKIMKTQQKLQAFQMSHH
jgi:hypothetical protein